MNDFDVAVIGRWCCAPVSRPGAGLGSAPGGGGRGGCATQRTGRSHARTPLPATECRRAICWPSERDEVKGYDGQVDGRPQARVADALAGRSQIAVALGDPSASSRAALSPTLKAVKAVVGK